MTNQKREPILSLTQPDGSIYDVTVEELCLTNNLTYQALVTLLAKKGIIEPEELLAEVERVQKERLGDINSLQPEQ